MFKTRSSYCICVQIFPLSEVISSGQIMLAQFYSQTALHTLLDKKSRVYGRHCNSCAQSRARQDI